MSYVAMEQAICPVCNVIFESGNILLDKKLEDIPKDKAITHYDLCDKCKGLIDEGYVHCIEIDPDKTNFKDSDNISLEDAHRTGRSFSIKRPVLQEIIPTYDGESNIIFLAEGGYNMIVGMIKDSEE